MTNTINSLAVYGDRQELREMSERLTQMLPGVKQIGQAGALALAQVSLSMGLNPFVGEVWAIPQTNRSGQIVGFSIMAGIKGLRRAAKRQAQALGAVYPYYRPTFRFLTEEEKELGNVTALDKALICELEIVLPAGHPFYANSESGFRRFIIEGIGILRAGGTSKMEPYQLVKKRAEADALKIAFDLPFANPGERIEDDFSVEANFTVSEPEPESDPEPEIIPPPVTRKNGNGHSWSGVIIQAILEANLAENARQAVGMLNKSKTIAPDTDLDAILEWASVYRGHRDSGMDSDEAAAAADKLA